MDKSYQKEIKRIDELITKRMGEIANTPLNKRVGGFNELYYIRSKINNLMFQLNQEEQIILFQIGLEEWRAKSQILYRCVGVAAGAVILIWVYVVFKTISY